MVANTSLRHPSDEADKKQLAMAREEGKAVEAEFKEIEIKTGRE